MKKVILKCLLVCMCLLSLGLGNAYADSDAYGPTLPSLSSMLPFTVNGNTYTDVIQQQDGTYFFYNPDPAHPNAYYYKPYNYALLSYTNYVQVYWISWLSTYYWADNQSADNFAGPVNLSGHSSVDLINLTSWTGYSPVVVGGNAQTDNSVALTHDVPNGSGFPVSTPKLIINIEPLEGGNVTGSGISCNVNTSSICQYSEVQGTQVTLTASANCGWTFANWSDGTISTTTNPLTVTMDGNKNMTASFLPILSFPLSGTLVGRGTPLMSFGDTWTFGECPTGTYKKHAGIDLQATVGEAVYSAHSGTIKEVFTGEHSQWADAIVLEDDNSQYTTVYWHINAYGNLNAGDHVTKGQQIATVADLGTNTHFHFGIRIASYDSNFSLAGALPQSSCGNYPAFPEFFADPQLITYQ